MGQSCSVDEAALPAATRAYQAQKASEKQPGLAEAVHAGSVLHVASSALFPEGGVLSCSDDKTLALTQWPQNADIPLETAPNRLRGHSKAVNRLCMDGTRGHAWSASRDLSARQWDLSTGKCLQTFADAHELNLSAVALDESGDGSRVFTGSRDYAVKEWDVSTGKCTRTFKAPRNIVTALKVGSSSGDGQGLLYQCAEDLKVRVWDPKRHQSVPAMELSKYVYFPLCIDLHSDGHTLVTGCKGFNGVGCEVKLWDLRAPTNPLFEGVGHTQDVTACSFLLSDGGNSGDGVGLLVTTCKDGSVRLWDAAGGGEVCKYSGDKIYTSVAQIHGTASVNGSDERDIFSLCVGSFDGSMQRLGVRQAADGALSMVLRDITPAHFEPLEVE